MPTKQHVVKVTLYLLEENVRVLDVTRLEMIKAGAPRGSTTISQLVNMAIEQVWPKSEGRIKV